jgi:hypothetical protein
MICQILVLPLLTLKNIDIDFQASLLRGQTTPRNSSLDNMQDFFLICTS